MTSCFTSSSRGQTSHFSSEAAASVTPISRCKITLADKLVTIIDMLCPEMPELIHSNIQPGFHVAIEMNNSGIFYLLHADAWIIPKPKNVPRFVQRLCCGVECYQTGRQCTQLPQCSVLILQ